MSEITGANQPIVLTSARDVKVYKRLSPDADLTATLCGIIVRVNKRGGIIFFNLYDGSDSIQIIANRNDFAPSDWEKIKGIKVSSRITVNNLEVTFPSSGRISLVLNKLPSLEANIAISVPKSEQENVKIQILLSHLRNLAGKYLRDKGFLEIEPNFISSSWDIGGIQPLRVNYPGFGVSAYLMPSPAPQLLKSAIVSGQNNVFCVSRCFTVTYRERNRSAESLILTAKMLICEFEDIINTASQIVREIYNHTLTEAELAVFLDSNFSSNNTKWPLNPAMLELTKPEIYFFDDVPVNKLKNYQNEIKLFQLYWPPNVMILEGFWGYLGGEIPIGTFTIHLESIAKVLTPHEIWHLCDHTKFISDSLTQGTLK